MKRLFYLGAIGATAAMVVAGWVAYSFRPGGEIPAGPTEVVPLTRTAAPRVPAPMPVPTPVAVALPAPPGPSAVLHAPEPIKPGPPFQQFNLWAAQFIAGTGQVSAARGEALAWKRREALRELIRTDPRAALAMAVPFAWRRDLPSNITRHFERQIDGRGSLQVLAATDFERSKATVLREVTLGTNIYQAFVFGRRDRQSSRENIPLHGIAIENLLALDPSPIRILAPQEAAARMPRDPGESHPCKLCERSAVLAGDVGGTVALFCGPEHARLAEKRLIQEEEDGSAAFAPGDEPGKAPWSLGSKQLLYMRLNFPDDLTEPISESSAYSVMNQVNAFYVEGSYNQTAINSIVTPLLTLPQTKGWYATAGPGALLSNAREAARLAGFDTSNYALDIASFTSVPDYDWGGLGAVGGKGTWLQSSGAGVTAHELGHNYGLWHGNFWDTGTNLNGTAYGTNIEYGNSFDTMGAAAAGRNHFNANFKSRLRWLSDPAVCTVLSNGVYRIYPFDTPARIEGRYYAARVRRGFDRDYWVEFREQFPNNPWFVHGVLLNWSAWDGSNRGTQLIDTTPGSPNGKDDAAVIVGRTFSDEAAGVHITPVGTGLTGTNRWIEVQVNTGFFESNRPPKVRLLVSTTNAVPGQTVHFQAEASDPDGDRLAYTWFGTSYDTDNPAIFSTNNLPWTYRSWSGAGVRVVRCVVSDMKGGVASANVAVRVGNPSGFSISGRIAAPDGTPLEGVRVTSDPEDDPLRVGYTDSRGEYIITGVQSPLTLQAIKYGFTFTNATWTNPVVAAANLRGIDFESAPVPSLRIEALTNAVPESDNTAQYFLLTHTAPTNQALAFTLNLSGSATPGGDYLLDPPLADGPNAVTIPEGTNSAVVRVQANNDAAAELPETITLSIIDDGSIVLAAAEATLTLIDDDIPNLPRVAVSSAIARVPEDGSDSVTFGLTRLGSVVADLPVFYALSGTATAGGDYPNQLGVIVIPAGQAGTQLKIPPLNDDQIEADETVTITLIANSGYSLGTSSAQATIVSDDVMKVTVFPTATQAAEPAVSTRVTFKREGDLSANLVIGYEVSGTATPGVDYQALGGSITIPAGATSVNVSVEPIDDALLEGDETVVITITNAPGCDSNNRASLVLAIRDNEPTPVSITTLLPQASEPGQDYGLFAISRGSVVNGPLVVPLFIGGSAVNGVDYLLLESQVVIPDGANSVTVDLIPFDDLHVEPTETVQLLILPGGYAVSGNPLVTLSILDDDAANPPGVGFSAPASRFEENRTPGISVSLSSTSASPITVEYRVIGGTASAGDFNLPDGTLTFEPGNRALSLPLAINDDSIAEPDETIRVVLLNPVGASFDGLKLHTYTIADDDAASLSVTTTVGDAFETGPVPGNFRITRTGSTTSNLLVRFEVTGSAAAAADYLSLGATAILPAGAAFLDLPVVPVNDFTEEFAETVRLTLLNAPGAKIVSPNSATVTIEDNDTDGRSIVSVHSTAGFYAVEGGAGGTFTFTRTGSTAAPLTVLYTTGGVARSGADYSPLPGSVTILAGQSSATVPVTAIDDALVEGEEPVTLTLTSGDAYRVAFPSAATVFIQDNEQSVRVDPSDLVAAEPGVNRGELTFTRFGTTNTPLQVFFSSSGTATPGSDYVPPGSSVIIPAGSLTLQVPIVALDDLLVEGPETVIVQLQPNPAYVLESGLSATVTIEDDEPMLTLALNTDSIVEGSPDPAILTVTRSGDPRYEITALLSVGGSAGFGVDYPPFATNIHFSCGIMAVDLLIFPTNELASESLETLTTSLLPHASYTVLAPSNATLSIVDAGQNFAPAITITSPTVDQVFLLSSNANLILEATVAPQNTNAPLNVLWTKVEGPETFSFGTNTNATTTVSFTDTGVYVLRLTADDERLTNYAQLTVAVGPQEWFATNSLFWSMDDMAGTNVSDWSGFGRTGEVAGGFFWSSNGVRGGALQLDGAGSYARETTPSGWLNGLASFTLSLWARSPLTNVDQGLFAADDSGLNPTLELRRLGSASCGLATNVIEAVIPTDEGVVRYVSRSNAVTNDWQHLTLTWSNSVAPTLYVNGAPAHPFSQAFTLEGALQDCPQFLVGRGSGPLPQSWAGEVDDVRFFTRALSRAEIAALAALPPANYGAVVDAGPDATVQVTALATLAGWILDDGQPQPPGTVTNVWVVAAAAGTATLTNAAALTNDVSFDTVGEYVFRLIADDGQVKTFDDVVITVIEPTRVDIFAFDPEAAELGPDTGGFTLFRTGQDTIDLPVFLAFSGSASNGADFVAITNALMFPAGSNSLELVISPYLDDRTEGDEPFIITIVSNAAYGIGVPETTVTIHDSPYGAWTVSHFTLEELTDPTLSGADADFDHDRLLNFAEYAANRDPRSPETNPPVVMTFETNVGDGKTYPTLTYPRRLEPTDTGYAVHVSFDLFTWFTGPEFVQEIQALPDANGITETVTARTLLPFSTGTNQFATVKVWLRVTKPE